MKRKRGKVVQTVSLEKAVAMIPDGASLIIGGSMGVIAPDHATIERGL